MATARAAIGSALSVVAKTGNTLVNTVDTIDTGIGILNDYARSARRHQKLASAGRETNFIENLETTLAQEAAEIRYNAQQWAAQNPELNAIFEEQRAKIREAILKAEATL